MFIFVFILVLMATLYSFTSVRKRDTLPNMNVVGNAILFVLTMTATGTSLFGMI